MGMRMETREKAISGQQDQTVSVQARRNACERTNRLPTRAKYKLGYLAHSKVFITFAWARVHPKSMGAFAQPVFSTTTLCAI